MAICKWRVVRGPESCPIILSTKLGYVLYRPVGIPLPGQGDSSIQRKK